MGLSITGITLMQVHWMLKTIKLNEENFDRAVNETLTSVVDKLEKEKNIKFSIPIQNQFWNPQYSRSFYYDSTTWSHRAKPTREFTRSEYHEQVDTYYELTQDEDNLIDSIEPLDDEFFDLELNTYIPSDQDEKELKLKYLDSFERVKLNQYKNISKGLGNIKIAKAFPSISLTKSSVDTVDRAIKIFRKGSESKIIIITNGKPDTVDFNNFPSKLIPPPPPPPVEDIVVENTYPLYNQYITRRKNIQNSKIKHRIDSLNHQQLNKKIIALNGKKIEQQRKRQEQALNQFAYEIGARKMELKDRVNFEEFHNLLSIELKNKGVMNPFEYALVNIDSVRKIVYSSQNYNSEPNKSVYKTRLFPNNIIPLNDYIEVKFPDKDFSIYKSAILPISASLFFTLIVFLTFAITLVTIIKQKKLAEMKADFINNMTHELKTPIATISLASDSIDNPKVIDKPETVKYFTTIIREENSRMNKLVESVLQTARLERKTLKLNLKEINLSLLTEKVGEQMAIQAEARGGSIHFDIFTDITMIADENLMENVIFNLIDNAIKYSSSAPKVEIKLKKLPGGISLSVEDNGIGMNRSEQQRVFEKFYRVSQGDVHNIKGFGLGLSNVKEITELHGGMVQLRSEPEKGSTFTLFFPFKVNSNE